MRVCHNDVRLVSAYITAQREAEGAFGNKDVYIEKFVSNVRHVEVQILADKYGNAIHLGERDCTIQRRRQKLIEETQIKLHSLCLLQDCNLLSYLLILAVADHEPLKI